MSGMNILHHIDKRNSKYCMIISIDVDKAFDRVHHPFMIKVLNKMETFSVLSKLYITNPLQPLHSMGKNQKPFHQDLAQGKTDPS